MESQKRKGGRKKVKDLDPMTQVAQYVRLSEIDTVGGMEAAREVAVDAIVKKAARMKKSMLIKK